MSFLTDFLKRRKSLRIVQHDSATDELKVGGDVVTVAAAAGADGDFIYLAYASASDGTGFTQTFNDALDYVAIRRSATEIVTPVASDFAGLWHGWTGADGNTIISGTAAPTTEGVDGDYYIRTTTSFIYGPKASGTWPSGVAMVGTNGTNGTNGTDGADGLDGANGAAGNKGGLIYTFGLATADGDPADGKFRLNNTTVGSITALRIDDVDNASVNMESVIQTWKDGDIIDIRSNSTSGTSFIQVRVTGKAVDATGYWNVPVVYMSGARPASDEVCAIQRLSQGNKGGIRYDYNNTTSGDPGSGFFRMNSTTTASVTSLFIDDEAIGGVSMTTFLDSWSKNGTIHIQLNSNYGAAFARFKINAAITDSGTHYTIPVTYVAGSNFTNTDECVINYIPSPNVSWDGTDLLDDTGVSISTPLAVDDYADLPTASTVTDKAYLVRNIGLHGIYYHSDGSVWSPVNGECMYSKSQGAFSYIAPNTQATAVGDNGGFLQVTAATHTLTTSPAVGAKVYVSAGTGWTVGFYTILSVDSVNAYTLNVARGTLGVPTIALANTQVRAVSIALHPLLASSTVNLDMTTDYTDTADDKRFKVLLGATELISINSTTLGTFITRGFYGFSNNGATNAQIGKFSLATSTGTGNGTVALPTATVDTSVATTFNIDLLPAVSNQVCRIVSYDMRLSQ